MEPERSVFHTRRLLPKRSRSALACNACRKVKSKCDGERPTCGRCAKQNAACIYTQNVHDRRMERQEERRAHIALKCKVDELESRLAAVGTSDTAANDDSDRDSLREGSDAGSRATNKSSAVDILATGAFDYRPAAEIGYFGPTSNHSLFRSVTTAMVNAGYRLTLLRHGSERAPVHPSEYTTPDQVPPAERPRLNPRVDNPYPNANIAKQWIRLFFDTVGGVLPYVTEAALLKEMDGGSRIEAGKFGSQSVEALVNIVFAHALAASHADGLSEPFYRRAVALLLTEEQSVCNPTIFTALLLLGSFQQNSQRAMASLSSHALVVKASYQLGLHSPSCYEGLSTLDKELRAKLWFAVVNQDMILATALGRPCLVPPHYVQRDILDILAPGYVGVHDATLSPVTESMVYFHHLSSLHEIMGCSVESLYGSNMGFLSKLQPDELSTKTSALFLRLQTWRDNVRPFRLLAPTANLSQWPPAQFQAERFVLLLSIYYHKTVMLACAPLLTMLLERAVDYAATEGARHSYLLDLAGPLLRHDIHSIKEFQRMARGLLQHDPLFFPKNAVWWVCNFTSLTMSLQLFALWMVCLQLEAVPFTIGHTASEIEALLVAAVEILRDVGGTSMMSRKGYHCLQRYIGLARAIALRSPNGEPAETSVNLDDLFHDMQQDPSFSSGAFLWDGFPDASMTHVGDVFFQHLDMGFLSGGLDMGEVYVPEE